jgi:outer membrane protein assembly factor BamB
MAWLQVMDPQSMFRLVGFTRRDVIIDPYYQYQMRHHLLRRLVNQHLAGIPLVRSVWLIGLLSLMLLWGCGKSVPIQSPLSLHRLVEESLVDATISQDATLAVTLSRSRQLTLWSLASKQAIYRWQAQDFTDPLYLVALSNDKHYLAVAGKHQVFILDLNNGSLDISWQAQGFDSDASISSIGLSHSGKGIVIGMNDGAVIVVDRSSQTQSIFKQHTAAVSHVEFYAAGDRVFSTGHDGVALLWSSADGKPVAQYALPQRIVSHSFDAANRRIFIADALDNQMIIDSDTGQKLARLDYLERYRYFRQALFAFRGKVLITATSKQEVISWDLDTGQELAHWQLTAFTAGTTVVSMAMDAKGQLLTLSSDGALESWSVH